MLPKDDIFHLLQTQRRRDVLRYLQDRNGPIELRNLAEQVAAWEQETTIESLTSSERQRVYISLYQTHLPKLDEHEIVDYNKDRGLVERCPRASQLESYLDVQSQQPVRDPWPRRYGTVVLLCGVLSGGAIVLGEFSSPFWLTLLVLAAVGLVAVAHWRSNRGELDRESVLS
ncbi:DUF7344 domain-containing protein [Halostagnicola bangensis]